MPAAVKDVAAVVRHELDSLPFRFYFHKTGDMADWSLLTRYLGDVGDGVTLTWSELDHVVGGLPASAARHRAWWSGDRSHVHAWRSAGFAITDIRMGERVSFLRVADPAGAAPDKLRNLGTPQATPRSDAAR